MNAAEASSSEPSSSLPAEPPAAPRKRPPWWGILLFLLLLGGFVILNHCVGVGGPEILWIDVNDEKELEAALAQVSDAKPRLLLYLYDPKDQVHARNEREVFTKRWARDPLVKAVCCRAAVRPGDPLAEKYVYRSAPLFLLLDRKGEVAMGGRTEGAVTELQFFTYITRPLQDAGRAASEGAAKAP